MDYSIGGRWWWCASMLGWRIGRAASPLLRFVSIFSRFGFVQLLLLAPVFEWFHRFGGVCFWEPNLFWLVHFSKFVGFRCCHRLLLHKFSINWTLFQVVREFFIHQPVKSLNSKDTLIVRWISHRSFDVKFQLFITNIHCNNFHHEHRSQLSPYWEMVFLTRVVYECLHPCQPRQNLLVQRIFQFELASSLFQ